MKIFFFLTSSLLCATIIAQNQNVKFCSQWEMQQKYFEENPGLQQQILQNQQELEQHTQQFIQNKRGASGCYQYVIPVVFHILHDNGGENLTEETIKDAIKQLNIDFQLRNEDTADVVADFIPILGNSEIEFRLAQKDPNGNATDGMIRYETQETYSAGDNIKPGKQWPRSMYLNIYTAINIGGAAGYTYLPGSTSSGNDAILVLYNYVGLNKRTLTHEIGHWLNLSHCWGGTNDPALASNCNSDDNVGDTPNTIGWQVCNLGGESCGSLDNVQNYMEYSFCSNMFTKGQATRMQAAINSSTGSRSNLWKSSNLIATGVNDLELAEFSSSTIIACKGEDVYFEDESKYGQCNWNWTFDGGSPSSSNDRYPVVKYYTPGIYDVSLTVDNNSISQSKTKSSYILVIDPSEGYAPFTEGFENGSLPNNNWLIYNPDGDSKAWMHTSDAAYTGTSSAKMNNINNTPGNLDELLCGGFDFTSMASIALSFKVAYAQRDAADNDILRLYVSKDCGATWVIRWAKTGSSLATVPVQFPVFTPASQSEWQEYSINITSTLLSENFLFKFEFESDGGNNLYLDDINIEGVWNSKPVLQSPTDGVVGQADDVILDWKAVGAIDLYEWQLDVSNQFNTGSLQTGTTNFISTDPNNPDTEFQTSNLTYSQTYYWRVRTTASANTSLWSDIWSFTVSETGVGIGGLNVQSSRFNLFPNPSDGIFEVKLAPSASTSQKGEFRVLVYNVLGEQIHHQIITSANRLIDISSHPKGIYHVLIISGDTAVSGKIILQ
ncbi:MAG: hypothetical protein COA57_02900 [Flavobacteriales bacterium]|nr:MAG: hypothetical protein COA57_02900 [Flavobacteriales bacterium]